MSVVVSQLQLIQGQWSVGHFDRSWQLNIHTETTAGGMTTWCNQSVTSEVDDESMCVGQSVWMVLSCVVSASDSHSLLLTTHCSSHVQRHWAREVGRYRVSLYHVQVVPWYCHFLSDWPFACPVSRHRECQ